MAYKVIPAGVALACAMLAGCASVPREDAARHIDELGAARGMPAASWPTAPAAEDQSQHTQELIAEPLTLERVVQLAFMRNSGIREAYAALGIAESEVIEASRLANPTFGYIDLGSDQAGAHPQITRSLALDFADLLLLPARRRIARAEFESTQQRIGAALVELAANVQKAWYDYVGAQQVSAMRRTAAEAATASADFARRSHAAGNITPRNLALELAAESEARIAAARAAVATTEARGALALLIGMSTRDKWQTPDKLPTPPAGNLEESALLEAALGNRLDVAAMRREVATLDDALAVTRHWRFFGDIEVGYEWESETDGARLKGPSIALQVPLFNQGQGAVLRAQAQLELARAQLSTLELKVRNDVALGLDLVAAAHEIAESFRTALIPQREAVVGRTLEQYNFMLSGTFELLQAKREEIDAYQEYLEAVRDYWLARVALRRTVGGRLPDDGRPPDPTIGAPTPQASLDDARVHIAGDTP